MYQSMECLGKKIKRFCKSVASYLPIIRMLKQNDLQIFYLKKSSTKQDKKLTSPFALKEIFVYLCRDRIDITVAEHGGEQVIKQAVIRLFTTTSVNLTERLKVLQRLLS